TARGRHGRCRDRDIPAVLDKHCKTTGLVGKRFSGTGLLYFFCSRGRCPSVRTNSAPSPTAYDASGRTPHGVRDRSSYFAPRFRTTPSPFSFWKKILPSA